MSFNINKINTLNNAFVGAKSAKPIVGHLTKTNFLNLVQNAKLDGTDAIVAGTPLTIKTISGADGLNPNTFIATKATSADDLSGFSIASNTDIVSQDTEAPMAYPTQIINVAILGSGVELYLPVSSSDTTLLAGNINLNQALSYDFDNGGVKIDTTGTIKAFSNVLDGVKAKDDGSFESCKVIKVIL